MRIRTIKPEFFHHEGLFELEKETNLPIRIAFAGLWCVCDREGRFKWEPRRIGVQVLPYDNLEFSRVLDALVTRAFVVKYRVGDEWFGCVPGFKKHQVINNRESESTIPAQNASQVPDTNVNKPDQTTRGARVLSPDGDACSGERKGKEGKGRSSDGDASGVDGQSTLFEDLEPLTDPAPMLQPEAKPRNELLDALVAVDGTDPLKATSPMFSQAAKALKTIREVCPEVAVAEIQQKVKAYREKFKDASISSTALAKHWGGLNAQPARRRTGIPNI